MIHKHCVFYLSRHLETVSTRGTIEYKYFNWASAKGIMDLALTKSMAIDLYKSILREFQADDV